MRLGYCGRFRPSRFGDPGIIWQGYPETLCVCDKCKNQIVLIVLIAAGVTMPQRFH